MFNLSEQFHDIAIVAALSPQLQREQAMRKELLTGRIRLV
jgi:hypothetical protein